MTDHLVKITSDISFADLKTGKVNRIDAYHSIIKKWLIQPARNIADSYTNETDHGMALLGIELMFFEPQGQFLTGESSQGQSKYTFCEAFNDFKLYLANQNYLEQKNENIPAESFYKWARCGLFHSFRLADKLLIDAIDYTTHCMEKNEIYGGWLVDPWKLLPAIENYINNYVKESKDGSDEYSIEKFHDTFNRLVYNPLQNSES